MDDAQPEHVTHAALKKEPPRLEGGSFLGGAGCLLVVGMLLTSTGIFAVIGVPILLVVFTYGFVVAMSNRVEKWYGPCPHCGVEAEVAPDVSEAECTKCTNRFSIEEGTFTAID